MSLPFNHQPQYPQQPVEYPVQQSMPYSPQYDQQVQQPYMIQPAYGAPSSYYPQQIGYQQAYALQPQPYFVPRPIPPKYILEQTPENYSMPIWSQNPFRAAGNYSTNFSKHAKLGFWFALIIWIYWVIIIVGGYLMLTSMTTQDQLSSFENTFGSFILLGIGVDIVLGIPAIIFSHMGLYFCKKYGFAGKGFAIWGLLLSYAPPVLVITGVILLSTIAPLLALS